MQWYTNGHAHLEYEIPCIPLRNMEVQRVLYNWKLECLQSEGYRTPPHDYLYYWVILDPKSKEDKVKVTNLNNLPKFQIFEFWNKCDARHTFWNYLIKCANIKWIQWVLLKIQSGHDSVHRRTDGREERRTRWNQYSSLSTSLKWGVQLFQIW